MHQCIHSTECYYEVSGRDMFMRSRDVQSQLADGAVLSLTGSLKASCVIWVCPWLTKAALKKHVQMMSNFESMQQDEVRREY